MKNAIVLLAFSIVGCNFAYAQDAKPATSAPQVPASQSVAGKEQVQTEQSNKKKHGKEKQKQAQDQAPSMVKASDQAVQIDALVNKLVIEQRQVDPSHLISGEQVVNWKKRLENGEDYLTLSREIKNAAPPVPVAKDPDAPHFDFPGGTTFDYGTIKESNEPTPHDFEFVNTGKKPLIIQEAHGSCGCTVPTYSHEPVLPGQKGVITVKYNTRGRVGPINKDVTITANTEPTPVMLHITGTVIANPDFQNPNPVPAVPQTNGNK